MEGVHEATDMPEAGPDRWARGVLPCWYEAACRRAHARVGRQGTSDPNHLLERT